MIKLSFSFIHLFLLRCFPSLVSPIEVDCEKVLRGDAGPPRQRRVVLHARGRDERRRRVEEGWVRPHARQFAEKVSTVLEWLSNFAFLPLVG